MNNVIPPPLSARFSLDDARHYVQLWRQSGLTVAAGLRRLWSLLSMGARHWSEYKLYFERDAAR
ncbi:hypothetical protein ABJ851_004210 [Shigella flexneri]|nr:hypothetical protein [Escherichia coli]